MISFLTSISTQKTKTREAVQAARTDGVDNQQGGVVRRRSRPRKEASRQSSQLCKLCNMLLLTETVLFYWDCVDYGYQTSQQAAKGNFAGLSDVKDWADVLASSKVLHSLPSQCASTHSHHARSASSSGTRVKAPRATPASTCASTCASTGASTPIADSVASASDPQDFEATDYRVVVTKPSAR